MYFMDFVKNTNVNPQCRYFLSGENDYLKNYVIDKLVEITGHKAVRISSSSEIDRVELFGEKKLFILESKSKLKVFQDFTVRLSKNKISTTYINANFTEIICSNLFPNQAEEFAAILLKERGMSFNPARTLARLSKHDPLTIFNTIQALSYLNKKLTDKELINYCSSLTLSETHKIIDYFLEGKYIDFLHHVRESQINLQDILYSLCLALIKVQAAWSNSSSAHTWHQKKLVSQAKRILPYRFEIIIPYVNDLYFSFGESQELLMLRLQKLIFYLRGFIFELKEV